MKRIILLATAILALAMSALPAAAMDIMPVDEVKAGMTGVGYSVFSGGEPAEFQVRIIGIVKKYMADQDLILAEVSGQNLEESGIVAGMSGSPIYIDGKLVGALAYAWSWAKRPIAGITPIEQMLEIWDNMDATGESGLGLAPDWKPENPVTAEVAGVGKVSMTPVATPLYMGGFGAKASAFIQENMAPRGLVPVQGGGVAEDEDIPGVNDLKPGSVVSVPMVSGDFMLGAIGTVTAREGDRILAFGHPFMGLGRLSVPMGGGSIVTVMPVQNVSFKIGNMGKALGIMEMDHQAGIAGVIGAQADTFPLNITVNSPLSGRHGEYHVRIAQLDEFMFMMLVLSIMEATDRVAGGGIVTVNQEIDVAIRNFDRTVHFEDTYYSSSGARPVQPISLALSVWDSDFRKNEFEEINVNITVLEQELYAKIQGFTLDRTEIHPGDTVTANVRLMPRDEKGKEIIRKVSVDIPQDAPQGEYKIAIMGGGYLGGTMKMAQPVNFEQWVDFLEDWIPGDSIVVALQYPGQAVTLEGYEAQGLPDTVMGAYMDAMPQNMKLVDRLLRKIVKADRVVDGSAIQTIIVTKEY